MNQIEFYWLIVWTHLGGWRNFENDSAYSDCMGGSVESGSKDKSDVNVWNDKIESVESDCNLMVDFMEVPMGVGIPETCN